MSTRLVFLVACLGLVVHPRIQAQVTNLDDAFHDGGRNNGAETLDTAWWMSGAAGAAALSVVTNGGNPQLLWNPGGSSAHLLGCFAEPMPEGIQAMATGDQIRVSLEFSVSGLVASNTSANRFRVGLFDSGGAGNRVSADGQGTTNAMFANATGYIVGFGAANTIIRIEQKLPASAALIAQSFGGTFSENVESNGGNGPSGAIRNGIVYQVELIVTTTAAGAEVAFSLTGDGLSGYSLSGQDDAGTPAPARFDMVALGILDSPDTIESITLDAFKVVHTLYGSGRMLTVEHGAGSGIYTNGATVAITADPPPSGEGFARWTGDVATVADAWAPVTSLTMPTSNLTVRANYVATRSSAIPPAVEMEGVAYQTDPEAVEVRWKSVKGSAYDVLRSANLSQWAVVASNHPPGGAEGASSTFTDSQTSGAEFYRVRTPFTRPNVLMIIGDDLRDLPALPGPNTNTVLMPNLDRLMARSMRFDRAFAQYPVCNPSRTSFLTGLRPDVTGVTDNSTCFRQTSASNAVTLPQLFRQSGYQTVSLGKVFHNVSAVNTPIDWPSWDVCKTIADPAYATDAIGRTGPSNNLTGGALNWCYWIQANGTDDNQIDGKIARDATNRLQQAQPVPFFLAVGLNKPHDPFIAPAGYFDLYPTNLLRVHLDPAGKSNEVSLAIPSGTSKDAFAAFTDTERLEFLRAYYACATFEDAQIGRLLDALDQTGLWQNTIVVFLSDHGYHLGERQWWGKFTIFELSARVPVTVHVPGMTTAGQRCERLIELVDLYPTLAELAGLTPPAGLAGQSLVPLLSNPALPGKPAAYTQTARGTSSGYSVRTGQWRFTDWSTGEKELYDHDADPGEWYNLASDPAYAGIVAQHQALLPPPSPVSGD